MIFSVVKSLLTSICIAIVAAYGLHRIRSDYLFQFLTSNIIIIQIGLLAINAATLGIVLTKLKDIIDKGVPLTQFDDVRMQMLLSIREQIALLVAAIIILSMAGASALPFNIPQIVFHILLFACFVYSLMILYDTAKSVFVVLDNAS